MRDEFLWVEKYRPKTIEDCILPENIKKTFRDFLNKGEVPNLLLSGPAGCGKTTVAKALCAELGVDVYVINGSDEGRFLDTVRNNAKNFASTVSLLAASRSIKSSSSMKQTIPLPTYSSFLERVLRSSPETADLFLPAITKTKSLNHSIADVPSLISELKENRNKRSRHAFSNVLTGSWTTNGFKVIRKSSQNSSISTSQTGEEY